MEEESLENNIEHSLFEVTIFMKGINGVWEIVVGILFLFFKTETICNAMIALTGYSIIKYFDYINDYLVYQANSFSPSTKYFIAFYFLFYGLVNIFLVFYLMKGKLWVYPAAIMFFVLFIVYQINRLILHYSGLLLFFTLFDVVLVFLTWKEYQRVKYKANLPKIVK